VLKVIGFLSGTYPLMAQLLYGSGLRLMEYIRLRVKGVDFAQRQMIVRDGKGLVLSEVEGMKDRVTMLPAVLITCLSLHF
jgi:integrase